MPLVNNKVGDDCAASGDKALADGKALVDSLMKISRVLSRGCDKNILRTEKVVACYRHLASCVGGCTDSLQLRDELRQTREKAQKLAGDVCHHLTSHLRDKSLPDGQRKEMELLWVAFSACLELLHVDMCKVLNISGIVSLADSASLVHTGLEGGCSDVAARALSLPDLNQVRTDSLPAGLESQERSTMELEIGQIDRMIDDMEMKVNVLRWMVEPHGPLYADPLSSTDSASMALLSVDEEQQAPTSQPLCQRSHMFALLLLLGVFFVASTLSLCIFFFS